MISDDQLEVKPYKVDFKIHILERSNYAIWKRHMENILEAHGLSQLVESAGENKIQDARTRALLTSALSEENQANVIDCKSAFDIWSRLTALHENTTSFRKSELLSELHGYKIKSSKDIGRAFSDIQQKAAQLKLLEEPVSEEAQMAAILRALPKTFNHFQSIWRGTPKADRTMNNLLSRLMAEVEEEEGTSEKALIVNKGIEPAGLNNGFGKTTQDRGVCFNCNKPGHWRRDCRQLQQRGFQSRINFQQRGNYPQRGGHQQNNYRSNASGRKYNNFGRPDLRQQERGLAADQQAGPSQSRPAAFTASKGVIGNWIADSGASVHITNEREWLSEYAPFDESLDIGLGDASSMKAIGSGQVHTSIGIIYDVHYVPEASNNLFSEGQVARKGVVVITEGNTKSFILNNQVIFKAYLIGGLYIVNFNIQTSPLIELKACPATFEDWHRRFGHVSKPLLEKMLRSKVVEGFELANENNYEDCVECALGKCHRVSHKTRTTTRANRPGISLHFDTAQPSSTASLGGAYYFVLCKDEFSSYRIIKFVSSKKDIADQVKLCISQAELETGNQVLRIVTDNGTEFVNKSLSYYLISQGINHKNSVPYTPQQNGFIERDIQTVQEMANTMLIDSGLPKTLWAEALNTSAYLLNRLLNKNSEVTPFELWNKRKPNVKNLRIFGQDAIVKIPDSQRTRKFEERGMQVKFVGYTDIFNTYRFFDGSRILVRCDAKFINHGNQQHDVVEACNEIHIQENSSGEEDDHPPASEDDLMSVSTESQLPISCPGSDLSQDIQEQSITHNDTFDDAESIGNPTTPTGSVRLSRPATMMRPSKSATCNSNQHNSSDDATQLYERIPNRSSTASNSTLIERMREIPKNLFIGTKAPQIITSTLRREPIKTKPFQIEFPKKHAKITTIEAINDPQTYSEAMQRPDHNKWERAMIEELDSLEKCHVWRLVPRRSVGPQENIVKSRWVLTIKRKPDGQVDRYKARLVACGYSQIYGVDFHETYAPVVNTTSIRILFAHAAMKNLKIGIFDVKTAFLNGDLDETIFMEQPPGFNQDSRLVCQLQKSLYGLKQSPRQWNIKFTNFIKETNLIMSEHDECIFYRKSPILILAIYVDDGIIFAENQEDINNIIIKLKQEFEIHTCQADTYLGFQIEYQNDGGIIIHQEGYINKILKRFNMSDANPVDSPISIGNSVEDDSPVNETTPYREAVGSLMYAATTTRIDIAYAVGKVSRKVSAPTNQDWKNVKRIFQYLSDKQKLGLNYHRSEDSGMIAYCDADFAGDSESSKSTTGLLLIFGGAPIHWRSIRQGMVTLSSTEAESISLCATVKDIIWLKRLAIEIGVIEQSPIRIYCDNQSAVRMAHNKKSINRTRHMGAQVAFVREQIENNEVTVDHVKAEYQLADMLTKATTIGQFVKNAAKLMFGFLTISTLLTCISGQGLVFDKVQPVVWASAGDKYVDKGVNMYSLDIDFRSPCAKLWDLSMPVQIPLRSSSDPNKIMEFETKIYVAKDPAISVEEVDFRKAVEHAVTYCNNHFDEHILLRIQQNIPQHQSNPGTAPKPKRSVAAVLAGMIISGFINWVWHEHDETQTSIKQESEREKLNGKFTRSMEELNITLLALRAAEQNLRSINLLTHTTKIRLDHMVTHHHVVWETAHYITAEIMETSGHIYSLLFTAVNDKRLRRDALNYLLKGLHREYWDHLELGSVKIMNVESTTANRFKITYRGRIRDPFTVIWRVEPFKFYSNLTGTPVLLGYNGMDYLMQNISNNCVKGIQYPAQDYINDSCDTKDYRDPRLADWQPLVRGIIPFKEQIHKTQYKESYPYVYVYCYGLNITVSKITSRCPPYTFKLESTLDWNSSDHRYQPMHVFSLNDTVDIKMLTHEIDTTHFWKNEQIIDENIALDHLHDALEKIERLQKASEDFIKLPLHGGQISHGIGWLLGSIVAILIMMVIFTMFNYKQSKCRHQKIMRTVTDGIYGEGIYEMAQQSKRKYKTAQPTIAGPSQVNVTLNGPTLPNRNT